MLIGGINTLTLLDYPGKVSCIIFTVGCNFRCGYCHNSQFVLPREVKKFRKHNLIPEEVFFKFLESRKGLLDGVVISGGEPTLQLGLLKFIGKIKELGLFVKLDTNGTNYEIVKKALNEKLVDYIAMDVKGSPSSYDKIANVKVDMRVIEKTKDLIMSSGIDYEFRTTVLKEMHTSKEILDIAKFCKGAKRFKLQNFRNIKVLDDKFKDYHGVSSTTMKMFKDIAEKYIKEVEIDI